MRSNLWSVGMTVSAPRRWALALAAWSGFVWVNRLRNLQADPDVAPLDEAVSLVLSGLSLTLALVAVVLVVRAWRSGGPSVDAIERGSYLTFAGWTIAVWVLRVIDIVVSWRSLGFVAVHVVLGAVSMVLAANLWRSVRPDALEVPIEHLTEQVGDDDLHPSAEA